MVWEDREMAQNNRCERCGLSQEVGFEKTTVSIAPEREVVDFSFCYSCRVRLRAVILEFATLSEREKRRCDVYNYVSD